MTRSRLGPALSACLLLVAAAGCSSDDGDESGGSPGASGSEAPQVDPDAPLDFSVVRDAAADLSSPDCAQPVWGENSTGAEGQVAFQQLDCWGEDQDPDSLLGGFPDIIQTVVWAELGSPEQAVAFADDQFDDRTVLVAGPTVLVASPSPWGDGAADLVAEVQDTCGCGRLRD